MAAAQPPPESWHQREDRPQQLFWAESSFTGRFDNSELHLTAGAGLLALSLALQHLSHVCPVNKTGSLSKQFTLLPAHSRSSPGIALSKPFFLNDILKLHFQLFKKVKSKNRTIPKLHVFIFSEYFRVI